MRSNIVALTEMLNQADLSILSMMRWPVAVVFARLMSLMTLIVRRFDLNLPALRVVRVLDRIAVNRGYPVMLRMDNGPEFISLALPEWAEIHAVKWSSSSRVSRRRTLSLSVLTEYTVQKYSILSVQNAE